MLNQIAAIHGTGVAVSPQPISGYSLWLDAADPDVFTYSSGTIVSQWNDKSANAYNFTQSTVGSQPSRNATQNGLSAVTFGSKFMGNGSLNWGSSASTVFVVAEEDKTLGTTFQNLVTTGTGSNNEWGYGIIDNTIPGGLGDTLAIFKIGQGYSSFGTAMTNGNADVLAFKTAGISAGTVIASGYKNGTAVTTQPATLSSTTSAIGIQIGANSTGGESYFGTMCEIILYPSQLSDVDRNLVEAYLKTKWGTP